MFNIVLFPQTINYWAFFSSVNKIRRLVFTKSLPSVTSIFTSASNAKCLNARLKISTRPFVGRSKGLRRFCSSWRHVSVLAISAQSGITLLVRRHVAIKSELHYYYLYKRARLFQSTQNGKLLQCSIRFHESLISEEYVLCKLAAYCIGR